MTKNIYLIFLLAFQSILCFADIPDGVYIIRSAVNSNHVLDLNEGRAYNGGKVHLWTYNGTNAQKWRISHYNGKYVIHSVVNDNYVLDLNEANAYNGATLQVWQWNGTNAQIWDIHIPAGEAFNAIFSTVNQNYVVDLDAGRLNDGSIIHLWQGYNNANNQRWIFDRVGGGPSYQPELHYTLCPRCYGAGKLPGTNTTCPNCAGAGHFSQYY